MSSRGSTPPTTRLALLLSLALLSCTRALADTPLVSDAFIVTESTIVNVTSDTDLVSYAKNYTIWPSEADPDDVLNALSFFAPGRVFIDYIDYEDVGGEINSSALVLIQVSGDSLDIVERYRVESERYNHDPQFKLDEDVTLESHLLVEVSLFHKRMLHEVQSSVSEGSLEIVIGDDVLFTRDESPEFSTDSSGGIELANSSALVSDDYTSLLLRNATILYVVAPDTPLYVYRFSVWLEGGSHLYIEAPTLVASQEITLSVNSNSTSNSVAFFDTVETTQATFEPGFFGKVCFDVSDSFKTANHSKTYFDPDNVALPDETADMTVSGTFSCVKASIPDRVPRDLSLATAGFTRADAAASSTDGGSGDGDALIVESTTASSDSSASASDSGSNGAQRLSLGSVLMAATLLVAAIVVV